MIRIFVAVFDPIIVAIGIVGVCTALSFQNVSEAITVCVRSQGKGRVLAALPWRL